jgi:hypothetical protein
MTTRPREPEPVTVEVRFERFPATIKGAFVMSGADGNPHAIQVEEAAVARIPSGGGKDVPLDEVRVDVAPGRDLFVPFEVAVSDLEPGWYRIGCRVRVDVGERGSFAGRPFSVAWPRGGNRRGAVPVGRKVRAGGMEVVVDRVEMAADHAVVVWRPERTGSADEATAEAVLIADGTPLEPLPAGASPGPRAPGPDQRSVSYPVSKGVRALQVAVRLKSGEESTPAKVPLA